VGFRIEINVSTSPEKGKRMAKRDENEAIGVHVAPQRPVLLPKPRKTEADIMTIGCKRYEGSAKKI